LRYLDFACGTGRVIGFVGEHFESVQGVDISKSMLEYAKAKAPEAKLICGDITEDDSIIGDDYDLITTFRFFLNAQPSLRAKVIKVLADKLSGEGILIFNIHNSKPSLLWLQNLIKGCVTFTPKPTLSRGDVMSLVANVNLEVIETRETGIMLKCLHRIMPSKLWLKSDEIFCRIPILRKFASHVLYVCRRRGVAEY
jgi:SAM-dependent methyltransferase